MPRHVIIDGYNLLGALGNPGAAIGSEDAREDVAGALQHGGGHGAVLLVAVDIAANAAAAEKRTRHEGGNHPRRESVRVVGLTDDLVDGRTSGAGFPAGRFGGEGGAGTVEVSVDALLVAADMIDIAHDKQLLPEWKKGREHIVEAFPLQGSGDTETEEDVESANGDFARGRGRGRRHHFLEERQTDSGAAQAAEQCASGKGHG